MKIFISWSGERSKAVAYALRDWLPLLLHYARPWLSERDIAAGERWAVEIGRELEGTHFGIVVLTADNLTAPWILFEVGALSKAFSASAVTPYLVDIEFMDISGPIAQFQAKKAEKDSTFELVDAVNSKAEQPIDRAKLKDLFDILWPKLEARLTALPSLKADAKPRSQAQILEELVTSVRRLEALDGSRNNPSDVSELTAKIAKLERVTRDAIDLNTHTEHQIAKISTRLEALHKAVDRYGNYSPAASPSVDRTMRGDTNAPAGERYIDQTRKQLIEIRFVPSRREIVGMLQMWIGGVILSAILSAIMAWHDSSFRNEPSFLTFMTALASMPWILVAILVRERRDLLLWAFISALISVFICFITLGLEEGLIAALFVDSVVAISGVLVGRYVAHFRSARGGDLSAMRPPHPGSLTLV